MKCAMDEPNPGPVDAPPQLVALAMESSARQIMSLIWLPGTSTEKKGAPREEHSVGCVVELKPWSPEKAVESSARRILSLILLPFSATEHKEKICIGDDRFPKKNGTCWSSRVVEHDSRPLVLVALSVQSSVGWIMSLRSLVPSAETQICIVDVELLEMNATSWSGRVVVLDPEQVDVASFRRGSIASA